MIITKSWFFRIAIIIVIIIIIIIFIVQSGAQAILDRKHIYIYMWRESAGVPMHYFYYLQCILYWEPLIIWNGVQSLKRAKIILKSSIPRPPPMRSPFNQEHPGRDPSLSHTPSAVVTAQEIGIYWSYSDQSIPNMRTSQTGFCLPVMFQMILVWAHLNL